MLSLADVGSVFDADSYVDPTPIHMTGPVLISDLIRDGKLMWVYCRTCCRERDVDPAAIPLPASHPVPDIGKRMRCSACGSREISTAPEHMPGGVVALRVNKRRLG